MPTTSRTVRLSSSSACAAPLRAILAFVPVSIGASAMLGWCFGVPTLKAVLPGMTTMKASAAFGIMATGLGLLFIPTRGGRVAWWRLGPASAAGALASVLGLLTLGEYATSIPFGIDELLFTYPNTTSLPYPGRLSPATAIALLCAGSAILLPYRPRARRPGIGGALAKRALRTCSP